MNFRLPPLPSTETLGWGIIGASRVAAEAFLPALRALPPLATQSRYPTPDSAALGIFSHNERHGRAFADQHAIPHHFANLADLLAQPSVHCVYVGNHPRHHAQTVLAALAAGKHILCEPPLALTVDEAEQVAHTALDRGRILAINFPQRGDSALRELRELLADHAIGDLIGGRISHTAVLPTARQSWRLRKPGGGVLLDRTAHTVDLLRFLLRDEIEQAYCGRGQQILGDEVEEEVLGIFNLRRSGLAIQTHDSFLVAPTPICVELYGNMGTLTVYDGWRSDRPSELWLHRHGQPTQIPTATTNTATNNVFFAAVQAFVRAVRTQGAPLASGADGVNNLAILHAAQTSLARGQRVPVALPMRRATDRAFS
jgi:1,5-anhydro-D-fructose reductase (1,5-anhydro-D-mannitol-forming)